MKTKQIVLVTIVFAVFSIVIDSIADNEINLQTVVSGVIQAIIFSLLLFTSGMKLMKKMGDRLVKSVPKVELRNDTAFRSRGKSFKRDRSHSTSLIFSGS